MNENEGCLRGGKSHDEVSQHASCDRARFSREFPTSSPNSATPFFSFAHEATTPDFFGVTPTLSYSKILSNLHGFLRTVMEWCSADAPKEWDDYLECQPERVLDVFRIPSVGSEPNKWGDTYMVLSLIFNFMVTTHRRDYGSLNFAPCSVYIQR